MDYYALYESIECSGAHVVAKKIEPANVQYHETFGAVIKYVCKRDGRAEITKELNPKTSKCENPVSHLDFGDTLNSEGMYVLKSGKRVDKIKKVHFSGQHNANEFKTSDYTFAEISHPFPIASKTTISLPKTYVSPLKRLLKR
jgi:hypothetical protein